MGLLRTIALLIGIAALLAGCGGGGKSTTTTTTSIANASYVQRVDAIANGLDALANNLTTNDSASPQTLLVSARAALLKAARQLAAINPPPRIKADHEKLVKAVDELAAELTPLISDASSGNFDSLGSALSSKGVNDARAAITAINKAGYNIQIPLLS